MSLPSYLARIKSSGIYRFVFDKSAVPAQVAETLRLVVGYSDKGPFNTPVYIENAADFTTIYGNASKRLERKGVFFHRMALQALSAGPILAMNIKPFGEEEKVNYVSFSASDLAMKEIVKMVEDAYGNITKEGTGEYTVAAVETKDIEITKVYDTNRFWKLDADQLPVKIGDNAGYISIAATDTKENSCTLFMRPIKPESYKGITIRQWYNSNGVEMPSYLDLIQDTDIDRYFAEVYVFRGQFTKELCSGNGPLHKYFNVVDDEIKINLEYTNVFGELDDALEALSKDSNSNFVGSYSGCLIPYFKDASGNYVSLDILFNNAHSNHKMMMKLDENVLDNKDSMGELVGTLSMLNIEDGEEILNDGVSLSGMNYETLPIYLSGYDYTSIAKKTEAIDIQKAVFGMFKTKGIRTALTNRVDVEYHYIVDTFDTLLNYTESKSILAGIAKEKDNAFAILNFPKMSNFTDDKDKTCYENGTLSMKKVCEKVTLPGDSEGASYAAYFTQLLFSDGTVKTTVPSAAIVSNNFMEKWSSRQPYYIVAGPTFGALSYSGMVGPDYSFGRSDLDVLEPYGVNAIIYVPRKGTYINSNQTAKQVPVSALSKIHIRELVIYLQNEIEALLQTYQWELNTQALRDTIKSKADVILETIKNNGGVYAYLNVCDGSNNTPEVIDNEMIILDTEIEPARGAGKMVHQLTIHKTGGLTSKVS